VSVHLQLNPAVLRALQFRADSHYPLQAQNLAPFGDGIGVVGSVLQAGDILSPIGQCLNTPFQCVPERTGLAATNWAIYADQKFNPFAFASVGLSSSAREISRR